MQEKSAVWGENGTFLVESKEGGELDGESGESHSTEKEERRESGLNQDEIDEEDEQDSMNNEYFAGGMGLLGFLVQTMILENPNVCLVLKYVDTKKGVVMDKRLKKFTIADRLAILHEYETSDLTGAEIAHKYGIKSASTISTWKNRLQNSKKSNIFAAGKESKRMMEDAERQELKSQIADLQRRLHESEMQNLALNTLIDVAEEQGLQIRKKSGAKQ